LAGRPRTTEEASAHPFPGPFDPDLFEKRLRDLGRRDPFCFPAPAVPSSFERSSVLICFWRERDDVRVLLTERAASLRRHPGQMSFPGGRLEAGEDWVDGALRETEEEVGLARDRVEVLGRLDDAWSGSGHLLVPIVGWLVEKPTLRPQPAEVERVHTPSVGALFSPDVFTREAVELAGERYYTSTFGWRAQGGEARVVGLSTDLLIEAIQWGIGIEDPHGPGRLASLASWLRMRAAQEAERREP
jgi:8-oxo-dGTP pyrophosphatase MutT (NUDIX family)